MGSRSLSPPGDWNDLSIFRDGLLAKLEPREKVVADKGYRGEKCVDLPFTKGDPHYEAYKQHIRSLHEHVNGDMKEFGCLTNRFRHELRKHAMVFRAVALIVRLKQG